MNLSRKSKPAKQAPVDVQDDDAQEEMTEETSPAGEDIDEDSVGNSQSQRPAIELKVPLSQALLSKLKKSAEEEGIAMTELAAELISEGLVMRVWEILERNQNIRGAGHPNNANVQGGDRHNNNNHRQNNQRNFNHQNRHHRGNRNQNNMNIMQDKAAFLEYVRNQERKRR